MHTGPGADAVQDMRMYLTDYPSASHPGPGVAEKPWHASRCDMHPASLQLHAPARRIGLGGLCVGILLNGLNYIMKAPPKDKTAMLLIACEVSCSACPWIGAPNH